MIYVSILIPAYNAELTIHKCIESALNQSIESEKVEIIILDDGSTDQTLSIVNDFKNRYGNISCFSQENKGISNTRAKLIKLAKGKYIQFLDSDDYLDENACEKTVYYAEKTKVDIVIFDYIRLVNNREELVLSSSLLDGVYSSNNYLKNFLTKDSSPALWNKLFKTEILKGILLPNDISFGEDLFMTTVAICRSNSVYRLSMPLIYYYYHDSGLSKKKVYIHYPDLIKLFGYLKCYVINGYDLENDFEIFESYNIFQFYFHQQYVNDEKYNAAFDLVHFKFLNSRLGSLSKFKLYRRLYLYLIRILRSGFIAKKLICCFNLLFFLKRKRM